MYGTEYYIFFSSTYNLKRVAASKNSYQNWNVPCHLDSACPDFAYLGFAYWHLAFACRHFAFPACRHSAYQRCPFPLDDNLVFVAKNVPRIMIDINIT